MHLEEAIVNVALLWILTAPHEFSHAWVATRLGDETPRQEGRVTLNPLAHVDWLGTAILPFITSLLGFGFLGWGKPVRTQTNRLRGGLNGLAMVALAGPASNLVLAVLLGAVAVGLAGVAPWLANFAAQGVWLSLYLAIFNMIPVPPLDGSKLLLALRIPMVIYMEVARAGFMILIVLMGFTRFGQYMGVWADQGARAILGLFR